MNKKEFLLEFNKEDPKQLFFLVGNDEYLKYEALKYVVSKLISEDRRELNCASLIDPDPKQIMDALQAQAFMGDKNTLIIKNSKFFEKTFSQKNKSKEEEDIVDQLKNLHTGIYVFICIEGNLDKKSRINNHFKSSIINFDPFNSKEAVDWIIDRFRRYGKSISYADASKLVFHVGQDSSVLSTEVQKLLAYCVDSKQISTEAIDAIAYNQSSLNIFNLNDAIFSGNIKNAFCILDDLLKNAENEYSIFTSLLFDLRRAYYIKSLANEGVPKNDIEKLASCMSFVVDKRLRALAKVSGENVYKAFKYCAEVDYQIKTGQISQNGIAQKCILSVYNILNSK